MDERSIEVGSVRERYPWFGLARIDEPDLSMRYRDILAEIRKNREVVGCYRCGAPR